jgi:hypothetical protein
MVRIRSEVAASSLLVLTIEKSISANGLGSNAHVAVTLARKLAADGYEVSIRSPTGRLDSADQFNHLLTSKSLNSEG